MTYGIGTRSWNNSTEHRRMKKLCREYTLRWLELDHEPVIVGPICHCRSFRLPHTLDRHRELPEGILDWRELNL